MRISEPGASNQWLECVHFANIVPRLPQLDRRRPDFGADLLAQAVNGRA